MEIKKNMLNSKIMQKKLGSAFQKINFLRDMGSDFNKLGRTYFPGIDFDKFNDKLKSQIEKDINLDFVKGYEGDKKTS